jgi:hypothetical protein
MKTEIGEYIVGAYLELIEKCDVVTYNVRTPEGGLKGLNELDVIGFKFKERKAFICEVTTHIRGTLYKDNQTTIAKIRKKHDWQVRYANEYLPEFPQREFMFWSPVVPKGYITKELIRIPNLILCINEEYSRRIEELKILARTETKDIGNPFFRTLQILGHLRLPSN